MYIELILNRCCIHSRRRKRRGLPVAGEKTSRDGKKTQMSGRVGDVSGKDKTAAAAAGKPADVRKSHEAENVKTTAGAASLDGRSDVALTDQGDADDRSFTVNSFITCV